MAITQDKATKTLLERYNEIYASRSEQLGINILGWRGGRPYVDERLSRFPGESDSDWAGGSRKDGSTFLGRKAQAHVIPYLARIVNKINQYVFSTEPIRAGVSEDVLNDITHDGKSIDSFMSEVNSLYTVCNWCWIGVDAPLVTEDKNGQVNQVSQEEKEINKIRPYWSVYSPLSVVDWLFNDLGELQWLITEGWDYVVASPYEEAYNQRYRKLWEFGKVTKFIYDTKDDSKLEDVIITNISLQNKIPFVLVGELSSEPHEFDDLESINRTIMDLESCNRQNFYNSCFPQMKIPVSVLDTVMSTYQVAAEEATQMVMGYNYPILMNETDKDPGFIMPDADALGAMREELTKLRKELFDSTGLLLQKDTKMVESAEAKAFDFMDIEAVLQERSRILTEAEDEAVKISKLWDSSFPVWSPSYNVSIKDNIDTDTEEAKTKTKIDLK